MKCVMNVTIKALVTIMTVPFPLMASSFHLTRLLALIHAARTSALLGLLAVMTTTNLKN